MCAQFGTIDIIQWNLSIKDVHIRNTSILRTQLLVPIQHILYYSTSVIRTPLYYGQFLRSPQVHYREIPLYMYILTDVILNFLIIVQLAELFTQQGFKVLENSYVQRQTINKKENVTAERIFIQGKFEKQSSTIRCTQIINGSTQ